jgi:hypothetical protein
MNRRTVTVGALMGALWLGASACAEEGTARFNRTTRLPLDIARPMLLGRPRSAEVDCQLSPLARAIAWGDGQFRFMAHVEAGALKLASASYALSETAAGVVVSVELTLDANAIKRLNPDYAWVGHEGGGRFIVDSLQHHLGMAEQIIDLAGKTGHLPEMRAALPDAPGNYGVGYLMHMLGGSVGAGPGFD